MNTGTHTNSGKTTVHLATFKLTWKGQDRFVRFCGINKGTSTTFLDDVRDRDASEVTCRTCAKIARHVPLRVAATQR